MTSRKWLVGLAVLTSGLLVRCGDAGVEPADEPVLTWTPAERAEHEAQAIDGPVTVAGSAYLAKYAPDGALVWAHPAAEPIEGLRVFDTMTLEDGSTMVAGTAPGETPSAHALVIAQHDAEGELAWYAFHDVHVPRQEGFGFGGIAALSDGGFVVAQAFVGRARFTLQSRVSPAIELASAGTTDGFVVKLDESGRVEWARRFGGMGYDDVTGVTALEDGSVLAIGHASDGADFDVDVELHGLDTPFVAKWRPDGALAWVQPIGGECASNVRAIAARPDGSFVVAGEATNAACMVSTDTAFISSFSPEGKLEWSRNISDVHPSPWSVSWTMQRAWDVAIADDGSIFTAGEGTTCFQIDPNRPCHYDLNAGFIVKLNASSSRAWHQLITGGQQAARTVNPTPDGSVWVTGEIEDVAVFSDTSMSLASRGAFDGFLARYDADGQPTLVRRVASGDNTATAHAAQVTDDGSIIVSGNMNGMAEFAPDPTPRVHEMQ